MPPKVNKAAAPFIRLAGKAGQLTIQNINPLEAIRDYCETRRIEAIEQTNREEIRQKRDVAVAAIQAQKEIIEKYFTMRFAERKEALSAFLNLLSHAVESKDEKVLDTALNGILAIMRDNPLKDFAAFRQARLDGQIIEI